MPTVYCGVWGLPPFARVFDYEFGENLAKADAAVYRKLQNTWGKVERAANRVTPGNRTSALVIGTASVISYYHPPAPEAWSALIFMTAFAARLLWVIRRTGRR